MSADRAGYTAGLRMLADALDAHPEVPLPYQGHGTPVTFHFLATADPRAEMAAAARALPCDWQKSTRDYDEGASYLDLAGRLGGLRVELTAYRDDVCERVVTGTEEREIEVTIQAAVTEKVTRTVETVEWRCSPIMAAAEPVLAGSAVTR